MKLYLNGLIVMGDLSHKKHGFFKIIKFSLATYPGEKYKDLSKWF